MHIFQFTVKIFYTGISGTPPFSPVSLIVSSCSYWDIIWLFWWSLHHSCLTHTFHNESWASRSCHPFTLHLAFVPEGGETWNLFLGCSLDDISVDSLLKDLEVLCLRYLPLLIQATSLSSISKYCVSWKVAEGMWKRGGYDFLLPFRLPLKQTDSSWHGATELPVRSKYEIAGNPFW